MLGLEDAGERPQLEFRCVMKRYHRVTECTQNMVLVFRLDSRWLN